MKDIAIIGGGITGLACAYYITKRYPSAKITIYEKSPRYGGWIMSERVEIENQDGSILFEAGPRSLRPAGNGVLSISMLIDLGLLDDTIFTLKTSAAATRRYIYYPDRLVRILGPPAQGWALDFFGNLVSEPIFEGVLLAVLKETFVPARDPTIKDESVASFIARRFDPRLADRLLSAVLHGIYAGDVNRLSAKSLLSGMWKLEGKHGSFGKATLHNMFGRAEMPSKREQNFMQDLRDLPQPSMDLQNRIKKSSVFTFRQGLGQLSHSLVGYLWDKPNMTFKHGTTVQSLQGRGTPGSGGRIHLSYKPDEDRDRPMRTHDHTHVIWTGTPSALGSLTNGSERLVEALRSIPTVSVMTVNLYYKGQALHPPGFGYLIPLAVPIEQNPENALGVVFDNSYSPEPTQKDGHIIGPQQDTVNVRGTKLTVMLGGHYWDAWPSYPSSAEGLNMAKSVLRRHLNITEEPVASNVNFNADCIPQYVVGHDSRMRRIHHLLGDMAGGSLRVAGSWINGVGVNDCLRSAFNTVADLETPGATGLESVVETDE